MFKKRENVAAIEEGNILSPKFDSDGLIPVITTDSKSGEVLMHGYMNSEALKKTIETKEAYYWSRSRREIWHKGETSGFVQKIVEIRIDDDQDSIWLNVDIGDGASCHVGYKSCFYRSVPLGKIQDSEKIEMKFKDKKKKFDEDEMLGLDKITNKDSKVLCLEEAAIPIFTLPFSKVSDYKQEQYNYRCNGENENVYNVRKYKSFFKNKWNVKNLFQSNIKSFIKKFFIYFSLKGFAYNFLLTKKY